MDYESVGSDMDEEYLSTSEIACQKVVDVIGHIIRYIWIITAVPLVIFLWFAVGFTPEKVYGTPHDNLYVFYDKVLSRIVCQYITSFCRLIGIPCLLITQGLAVIVLCFFMDKKTLPVPHQNQQQRRCEKCGKFNSSTFRKTHLTLPN